MGHFIWPALSLPHFTCSVVRYTLAKWIVSKNVPLQNLRPVASGIHLQCPCGAIRLHPVYMYYNMSYYAIKLLDVGKNHTISWVVKPRKTIFPNGRLKFKNNVCIELLNLIWLYNMEQYLYSYEICCCLCEIRFVHVRNWPW